MTGTDCKMSPLYMEPLRENLVFKKNEVKYISEYSSHLWRILMKLPHAHEYFRSYYITSPESRRKWPLGGRNGKILIDCNCLEAADEKWINPGVTAHTLCCQSLLESIFYRTTLFFHQSSGPFRGKNCFPFPCKWAWGLWIKF